MSSLTKKLGEFILDLRDRISDYFDERSKCPYCGTANESITKRGSFIGTEYYICRKCGKIYTK